MKKNYYDILGITDDEKKLSGDEFNKILKTKYRKICLENHPDRNPGNKEAEEKFKEAAEAYSVLSDSEKRKQYDNPTTGGANFNSGFNFNDFNIDDIFRGFGFGDFGGFGNFGRSDAVIKGSNMRIRLKLTLKEMFDGVTKTIKYKRLDKCGHCDGKGLTKDSKVEKCKKCGGTGRLLYNPTPFFQQMTTCDACHGTGKITTNPCSHCNGRGVVLTEKEVSIDIPKGAFHGMQLTLKGYGNAPDKMDGIYGDLIIDITQNADNEKYSREGNDLYFNINVPVLDAILGCDVTVNTIDGKKLSAKIPSGVTPGYAMRFKGYGMPNYGTSARGDMYGIVNIIMPKKLTREEKQKLLELKGSENFR